MAFTPSPTPPNSGDPASFNTQADPFLGWMAIFGAELNAQLPLISSQTWATYGGTANALALTAGFVSLSTGMQVRFKASATNTGAATINLDGLGAKACRTITGAALPAGYIRSDATTVATYDGTNWILDRLPEVGSNANGDFARFANGVQQCTAERSIGSIGAAAGAIYRSSPEHTWTFPAAFSTTAGLFVAASPRVTSGEWGKARAMSTTQGGIILLSPAVVPGTIICEAFATGPWY